MPDWFSSPAVSALVAALAALAASVATNWANSRREARSQEHQRTLQAERAELDKAESRFERRLDATLALISELRDQIRKREKFEEDHGQTPAEVYDYIELRMAFDLLTPVLVLCPEAVKDAAQKAVESCLDYVNDAGNRKTAEVAIDRLMDEARSAFA